MHTLLAKSSGIRVILHDFQAKFERTNPVAAECGGYAAVSTENFLRSIHLGLPDAGLYLPRIFSFLLEDKPSRLVFKQVETLSSVLHCVFLFYFDTGTGIKCISVCNVGCVCLSL